MTIVEPPTKLRGDLICVAEHGGDPRHLLEGSGVSYEDILAQRPVSRTTMAKLFDRLAANTEPEFAVTCGREIRTQYLGPLGYRLSNSETVGELLDCFAGWCVDIGHPLASALSCTGSTWRMSFEPRYELSPRAYRFCVESSLAAFPYALHGLSGLWIELQSIGFPFPRPADVSCYAELGVREIHFDCATGYVSGSITDLQRRIPSADLALRALCDDLCRRFWPATSESMPVADRLHHLLRAHGVMDLTHASISLGMSARSVQRHLTAEGKTFQSLLDDYRHEQAIRLVKSKQPNKAIAFALGFEDTKSFSRAFRRWTGLSASAWIALNG